MRPARPVFALLLPLLSACVSRPVMTEPFAGFSALQPAYPGLGAALVHGPATEAALRAARGFNRYNSAGLLPSPKVERSILAVLDVLKKNFKSAARAASPEAARAAGADVTAVLDADATYPKTNAAASLSLRLKLLDRAGRELATVGGSGTAHPSEVPGAWSGPNKMPNTILAAGAKALKELDGALRGSAALAAYASGSSVPSRPAPPSAPASVSAPPAAGGRAPEPAPASSVEKPAAPKPLTREQIREIDSQL